MEQSHGDNLRLTTLHIADLLGKMGISILVQLSEYLGADGQVVVTTEERVKSVTTSTLIIIVIAYYLTIQWALRYCSGDIAANETLIAAHCIHLFTLRSSTSAYFPVL